MRETIFPKTWQALLGRTVGNQNYWATIGKIPVGTRKPLEEYEGAVPDEEIVVIPFDPINIATTQRKAFNILMLAGSGDGKSLLMKLLWSILADAKYYCCYIDPKSTDSGRAKRGWKNNKLPPKLDPRGIKLKHFVPSFATRQIEHIVHHFAKYSTPLGQIDEREMWRGLGMTSIGASKTAKVIRRLGSEANLESLREELKELIDVELKQGSLDAMESVFADLEDYQVVDSNFETLDLLEEWKKNHSVCISYNSCGKILMTFDIGLKIWQASRYYFTHGNRNPIMFFFDDSSYYAKIMTNILKFNFAVEQILEIGNNYRSLGLYNCMAVQTLGIIDENVAETYRIKLISPKFQNPESLRNINVPQEAIDMLKFGELMKDDKRHLMQWILITHDNKVETFFPFLPPCNHFEDVYLPRSKEVAG